MLAGSGRVRNARRVLLCVTFLATVARTDSFPGVAPHAIETLASDGGWDGSIAVIGEDGAEVSVVATEAEAATLRRLARSQATNESGAFADELRRPDTRLLSEVLRGVEAGRLTAALQGPPVTLRAARLQDLGFVESLIPPLLEVSANPALAKPLQKSDTLRKRLLGVVSACLLLEHRSTERQGILTALGSFLSKWAVSGEVPTAVFDALAACDPSELSLPAVRGRVSDLILDELAQERPNRGVLAIVSRIGRDEQVEAVWRATLDGRLSAAAAAETLANARHPRATQVTAEALADPRSDSPYAACALLHAPELIDALVASLLAGKGYEPEVGLRALLQTEGGHAAAVSILERCATGGVPRLPAAAAAQAFLDAGRPDEARGLLRTMPKGAERVRVLRVFLRTGDCQYAEELSQAIRPNSAADVLYEGVLTLGDLVRHCNGPAGALAVLLKRSENLDGTIAEAVILGLKSASDQSATARLTRIALDPTVEERFRVLALHAVGDIGETRHAETLEPLCAYVDANGRVPPLVRTSAREAVGMIQARMAH